MPCDDGNPCTLDSCVPATGACVYEDNPCDDGDLCTFDTCELPGGCVHDAVVRGCDDGNPCTTDSCNPLTGACEADAVVCAAANKCELALCDPATGVCRTTAMPCYDGDACTTDSCNPVTGCVFVPDSNNVGCLAGSCNAETPYEACDVYGPLTVAYCVQLTGLCAVNTIADPCVAESCEYAEIVLGAAGFVCSKVGTDCGDGDPCTVDACPLGIPEPGADPCNHLPIIDCTGCTAHADCGDGDLCTVDSCDFATGACTTTPLTCPAGMVCSPVSGCTFEFLVQ
jgi:hypothetical protein